MLYHDYDGALNRRFGIQAFQRIDPAGSLDDIIDQAYVFGISTVYI